MSMLSAQCDELRAMAESVGLEAPQAATLMMGAADAIDQLKAENDKLRELVRDMFDGMCDHDRCDTCPHWQEGYNGCEYHAHMRELGVEVD